MKLEDRMREVLRFKHYSLRTEETYVGWLFPSGSLSVDPRADKPERRHHAHEARWDGRWPRR